VEAEHALPVKSDVPAVDARKAMLAVRVISCTASATDDVGTSTMAFTFS